MHIRVLRAASDWTHVLQKTKLLLKPEAPVVFLYAQED